MKLRLIGTREHIDLRLGPELYPGDPVERLLRRASSSPRIDSGSSVHYGEQRLLQHRNGRRIHDRRQRLRQAKRLRQGNASTTDVTSGLVQRLAQTQVAVAGRRALRRRTRYSRCFALCRQWRLGTLLRLLLLRSRQRRLVLHQSPSNWAGAGGTSFTSPILAGIQALVVQKWGRQGNPNPIYYKIAHAEYGTKAHPPATLRSAKASAPVAFSTT